MSPDDYGIDTGERLRDAMSSSWLRLADTWAAFRRAEIKLSEAGDADTGITRERWLLPLLHDLGFTGLHAVQSLSPGDDGKSYPISHEWRGRVPIHLMGWRTPIDRRTPGQRGTASASLPSSVRAGPPGSKVLATPTDGRGLRRRAASSRLARRSSG